MMATKEYERGTHHQSNRSIQAGQRPAVVVEQSCQKQKPLLVSLLSSSFSGLPHSPQDHKASSGSPHAACEDQWRISSNNLSGPSSVMFSCSSVCWVRDPQDAPFLNFHRRFKEGS
ncbi:hypothetical protein MUG91_G32n59 [Manis pentadactyla]|nr:hypothetical protein MUG91_G32n59 [Manis pentadactyla]